MGILDQVTGSQKVSLTVTLHENGALSVEGPIHDKKFCLAMLANAADAVRNHGKPGLVVPARDVQVPDQKVLNAS